jgi:hypothetical protein
MGLRPWLRLSEFFLRMPRVGVLFGGLVLSFNETRVFKSSRMQILRIPNASGSGLDAKAEPAAKWDWVIQALDVHICMPYRLQLRSLDDSFDEMLRALKLITSAKTKIILPFKKDGS